MRLHMDSATKSDVKRSPMVVARLQYGFHGLPQIHRWKGTRIGASPAALHRNRLEAAFTQAGMRLGQLEAENKRLEAENRSLREKSIASNGE